MKEKINSDGVIVCLHTMSFECPEFSEVKRFPFFILHARTSFQLEMLKFCLLLAKIPYDITSETFKNAICTNALSNFGGRLDSN